MPLPVFSQPFPQGQGSARVLITKPFGHQCEQAVEKACVGDARREQSAKSGLLPLRGVIGHVCWGHPRGGAPGKAGCWGFLRRRLRTGFNTLLGDQGRHPSGPQDGQKGCPARPQQARRRGVLFQYVEPPSAARTKLADSFNILLGIGVGLNTLEISSVKGN